MLFRFSLYGFLKNQTYFEPFLVLALMEKGLSFFAIGLLIGFREVVVNLFEVPSGALADLHGRRRCMVISFVSYICSFLIFAWGTELWQLLLAMFFFGGGEAFRSGTHKAMILDWLRLQGRETERTKVYGYTRSWSKIGSAVSVLIAAALVFYTGSYTSIFLLAVLPYLVNLVNLATYPTELDGERKTEISLRDMARHLWLVCRHSCTRSRRLLCESMGFEGVYAAVKDYLQPVLKAAALALPLLTALPASQRSAVLVGMVYFVVHLLSSWASRQAHRVQEYMGGEEPAARVLWLLNLGLYAALLLFSCLQVHGAIIAIFAFMAVAQNFWRPVLISRFDTHSEPAWGATLLSIEAQANSISTMLLAPLLGLAVDLANAGSPEAWTVNLWPVAAAGLLVTALLVHTAPKAEPLGAMPDNP